MLAAQSTRTFHACSGGFRLRNTGDTVTLIRSDGVRIDQVNYEDSEAVEGVPILFPQ